MRTVQTWIVQNEDTSNMDSSNMDSSKHMEGRKMYIYKNGVMIKRRNAITAVIKYNGVHSDGEERVTIAIDIRRNVKFWKSATRLTHNNLMINLTYESASELLFLLTREAQNNAEFNKFFVEMLNAPLITYRHD